MNAVQWGCGDILRRGERLLLVSTPAPLSLSASELPFASAPEFPRLRRWTQAWPPGLKTVTVQSQAAQEAQELKSSKKLRWDSKLSRRLLWGWLGLFTQMFPVSGSYTTPSLSFRSEWGDKPRKAVGTIPYR